MMLSPLLCGSIQIEHVSIQGAARADLVNILYLISILVGFGNVARGLLRLWCAARVGLVLGLNSAGGLAGLVAMLSVISRMRCATALAYSAAAFALWWAISALISTRFWFLSIKFRDACNSVTFLGVSSAIFILDGLFAFKKLDMLLFSIYSFPQKRKVNQFFKNIRKKINPKKI